MTLLEKVALATGGLIAVAIGAAILVIPTAFFASYGISLQPDPSLMSEIRAPGGALLAMGAVLCAALFRPALKIVALGLGALLYLSYGLARAVSALLDGWPDEGLVIAMGLELAIGAIFVVALIQGRQRRDDRLTGQARSV